MIKEIFYFNCSVGPGRKARMSAIPQKDKRDPCIPVSGGGFSERLRKKGISRDLYEHLKTNEAIIDDKGHDKIHVLALRELLMGRNSLPEFGLETREENSSDMVEAIVGRSCPFNLISRYGEDQNDTEEAICALMAGSVREWNKIKKVLDEHSVRIDLSGAVFPVEYPNIPDALQSTAFWSIAGLAAGGLCVKFGGDSPWSMLMAGTLGGVNGLIYHLSTKTYMKGLNLKNVDLTKARLEFLDLRGADFTGAITDGTSFRWSVVDTKNQGASGANNDNPST